MTKLCKKCGLVKALSDYQKRSGTAIGVQPYCRTCSVADNKRRYLLNRESRLATNRRWKERNPERYKEAIRNWELENREHKNELARIRNAANPDKVLARDRRWRARNKGTVAALAANRRAAKLRATPHWLSLDERRQIKEFYKNCPPGHHVDHKIPLRGKIVSGLHVLANLQYLPASENVRKNNKFVA